ncbi:MAG: hypothetical protein ACC707_16975, partial [Thiohalomonadales bacterium]
SIAILLLIIFLLRIQRKNLWAKSRSRDNKKLDSMHPSTHFYQIQRIHAILHSQGIIWQAHEPLLKWKHRYFYNMPNPSLEKGLDDIIKLYYRLCYEPVQHSQKSIIELEKKVDDWLKQYLTLYSVNSTS